MICNLFNLFSYCLDSRNYNILNDDDRGREILSLKLVSRMLTREVRDIREYVRSGSLLYIDSIIGSSTIYVFKRDLINYAMYVLNADVDDLINYDHNYDDILSDYPDKLYYRDIKYILHLNYGQNVEQVMKMNMNCKYDNNQCIYVDKTEFIQLLKRSRHSYGFSSPDIIINPFQFIEY